MQVQQMSSNNLTAKSERLEARVNLELKSRLLKAAQLQGSSLSDFIISSAEEVANEVIREHQILKLSTKESHAFVNAIFRKNKPNRKLQSAYLDYTKEVTSER